MVGNNACSVRIHVPSSESYHQVEARGEKAGIKRRPFDFCPVTLKEIVPVNSCEFSLLLFNTHSDPGSVSGRPFPSVWAMSSV